jgi:hypothetical protein
MRRSIAIAVSVGVLVAASARATWSTSSAVQAPGAADATKRIVAAAQAFLSTLDDAHRTKVVFPFGGEQKSRWSNLPTGIFAREGARLGDLTPPQRAAAMTLLSTAFSADGYQKVVGITRGDQVLVRPQTGGGGGVTFGEGEYYLAFVGTPSTSALWTLQFGGHHLGINMTFAGARATLAPTHTGAQPATYTVESRSVRPLGDENDKAFALMAALDTSQRNQAILGSTMSDLVLGPGRDGRAIQPEGVRASALSPSQQTMLVDLVREWVGIANDAFATPKMDEIRANLPQTYFAWSGPTTPGSQAARRISASRVRRS